MTPQSMATVLSPNLFGSVLSLFLKSAPVLWDLLLLLSLLLCGTAVILFPRACALSLFFL
jgi:hypothetical protein